MASSHTCFEIVHFAFLADITPQRQTEAMKALGSWAAAQPGFVSRQSYHDPRHDRWTDVVEWCRVRPGRMVDKFSGRIVDTQ